MALKIHNAALRAARVCESTACLCGGVITSLTIIVMVNYIALNKEQKKAFYDLTVSGPAALFLGSYFHYLRAKNNKYSIYKDAKQSFHDLEKNMIKFILVKKDAEIVASDPITNVDEISKRLEKQITDIENKVDGILEELEEDDKEEDMEESKE